MAVYTIDNLTTSTLALPAPVSKRIGPRLRMTVSVPATEFDKSPIYDLVNRGLIGLSVAADPDAPQSVELVPVQIGTPSIPTFTSGAAGVVPASGGGTANFLRADATWAAVASPSLVTSGAAGLAPATGGGTTNFLRADATWAAPPTPSTFTSGAAGIVPASGGGTANFLRADATWAAPPTPATVTSGAAGLAPATGGGTVNFLRADATFALPPTVTSGAAGYAPASGGGTTNFLRADASWQPAATLVSGTVPRSQLPEEGLLTVTYAASVAIDFDPLLSGYRLITLTGGITLTTTNLAAGRPVTVFMVAGASDRALAFPAWRWLGSAPTTLAAGKTGVLSLTSLGTINGDVVAAWAV